jgi:hypothetical protein
MTTETTQSVLAKIDWEIKKQERFLNLLLRAQQYKPADREVILKNACWIDGTVETQSQYARNKREKLIKAYRKLYDKWMK